MALRSSDGNSRGILPGAETILVAMPVTQSAVEPLGAELIGAVAAESDEALTAGLDADVAAMKAAHGRIVLRLGECERRQAFRDDGATSLETWAAERYGVSVATARGLVHVGKVAFDLPHLVGSLCAGDLSLDKVRALADVARPETDAELCAQAKECSVRDLVEVARTNAAVAASAAAEHAVAPGAGGAEARSEHDRRFSRCNDEHRTITAQLPPDSYAETKACLGARAKEVPSDGETPWDQRLCDAFLEMIRAQATGPGARGPSSAGSPFVVVAHVPLSSLVEGSGRGNGLAGELEHVGLIDAATVERIACDATVVVALDDDVGHTMYEGRARRFPTKAQRREVMRRDRHCRFPGCPNVTFTNAHHIKPWGSGGLTDLGNLVLLCQHHHGVVHRNGWTMTGNTNEELTLTGPKGQVMVSRPSALWARVSVVAADADQSSAGQSGLR